eukprot:CAMPEP_0194167840 /NCGR_PEP_ID=MMETSP0154-20130528/2996_1 /TAXON_ID=1049557 /ORGANISM="Thalassiothrix antarctica, Strain L6-D1" /LENGTH=202 /DNA_ID=CAMNT_0038878831 /DNA_START=49 /DNA_END=657 /DNA_ORIENTATION=+
MSNNFQVQSRQGCDARSLQEQLHDLITQISKTANVVKEWPDSTGDDTSIHDKETTKLIKSIQDIIKGLKNVEDVCKKDEVLWSKLKKCPIPLDLLDLMDCSGGGSGGVSGGSGGLNPEMFMRGLVREALSQLAGLRRRKVALEMLGSAIETGLEKKKQQSPSGATKTQKKKNKLKRNREDCDTTNNPDDCELDEPSLKKERV